MTKDCHAYFKPWRFWLRPRAYQKSSRESDINLTGLQDWDNGKRAAKSTFRLDSSPLIDTITSYVCLEVKKNRYRIIDSSEQWYNFLPIRLTTKVSWCLPIESLHIYTRSSFQRVYLYLVQFASASREDCPCLLQQQQATLSKYYRHHLLNISAPHWGRSQTGYTTINSVVSWSLPIHSIPRTIISLSTRKCLYRLGLGLGLGNRTRTVRLA